MMKNKQDMSVLFEADFSGKNMDLPASGNEERFLIRSDESIRTILPDEVPREPGQEALALVILPEDLLFKGFAGTSRQRTEHGVIPGGWADFDCRLVSARRFVVKRKEQILNRQDLRQILVMTVRETLKKSFTDVFRENPDLQSPQLNALLWRTSRTNVCMALLDAGWEINGFYFEQAR